VTGELRNVSLRQVRGRWLCAIQAQVADVAPADLAPTVGIDMGLAQFATLSGGLAIAPLRALAQQQRRLRRYQKAVSRKRKGSCNRKKAVAKLANLHARLAAQRTDWLHKLSTQIVKEHPVIAIEDLKVAAMSASARGTADAPGRKVKQKAALNRSILDASWEYKTAAVGGRVVAIDPAFTSQRCSECGHVDKRNRRTQSAFICLACGHAENADVNAAKNILAAGHAATACGEDVRRAKPARDKRAASAKQEPTEEACHA